MFSTIRKSIIEFRELRYLAYHDSLTGLLNRNWLYKNIDNIQHKCLYFIDINDLGKVNKKGHTFGDQYIKDAIKSILLIKDDVLIRYAGDEFILFSNRLNAIKTGHYFTVGFSTISKNITSSINIADSNMIEAKKYKQN